MNPNASLLDRAGLDKVRVGKLIDRGSKAPTTASCSSNTSNPRWGVRHGRLKQATYDTIRASGARRERRAVGYAHASDVSEARLRAPQTRCAP